MKRFLRFVLFLCFLLLNFFGDVALFAGSWKAPLSSSNAVPQYQDSRLGRISETDFLVFKSSHPLQKRQLLKVTLTKNGDEDEQEEDDDSKKHVSVPQYLPPVNYFTHFLPASLIEGRTQAEAPFSTYPGWLPGSSPQRFILFLVFRI